MVQFGVSDVAGDPMLGVKKGGLPGQVEDCADVAVAAEKLRLAVHLERGVRGALDDGVEFVTAGSHSTSETE